ncbi:non-canonical purine NTP diphosphatase [Aquimarina muelleri]|uniref:dITP/XTP pyrophosphatase n=1 Tax=Aquimarina muelleri TaxID=279356 RepID=A0A918JX26_9FLAO|nr:non-canonical purine NTP diphosphatase [Aquimarina muelleri]MCX2762995.1 non-canonical purine NTP diphosphatase [Aquimarina muelleri]GGX15315.1 non-canonical purine NTP pyrophosphatase [Aquimarina muelleri]
MKLVFATNNPNKIKEVQAMLASNIQIVSLQEIGCNEDIPETSPTIEGNAIQKAKYIKENYGYDCFADDTGLEVEILDGEPGVYSARYAGETKDANANMDKLLKKLETESNRKARFKTVIALVINDELNTFTGICSGSITKNKKGKDGFGYDPIFLPNEYTKTFAELPLAEKNKIGHRGKAMQQLINYFK